MDEQFIRVNNKAVRYFEMGQPHKPCVFLLHGAFGSAKVQWAEVMPLFEDNYYVVAVDLPGFGGSEAIATTNADTLAEWTKQVLDTLGLDKVIIIGNLYGALVGRIFAATYPAYVIALVMVNGGAIPSIPAMGKFLAKSPVIGNTIFKRLAKSEYNQSRLDMLFEDKLLLTDEFSRAVRQDQSALARIMRGLATAPSPQKRIPTAPVLLLWGEEDAIVTVETAKQIQGRIVQAKLSVISNTRHLPHIEAPDVFYYQVINFLKDELPENLF
ncbi:MAG: alpha/beta hydrolase [Phototrophicales bacterium]|nr:alpha/beta hydrolase [Phototrophicales bacterium]